MRDPDTSQDSEEVCGPNGRSQRPADDLLLQEVGSFAGRDPQGRMERALLEKQQAHSRYSISVCCMKEHSPPALLGPYQRHVTGGRDREVRWARICALVEVCGLTCTAAPLRAKCCDTLFRKFENCSRSCTPWGVTGQVRTAPTPAPWPVPRGPHLELAEPNLLHLFSDKRLNLWT